MMESIRRRGWRAGAAVTVVVALGVAWSVPQVRSYVSHIRGSPTSTEPLTAFPPGEEPELRLAVAGDVGYANDREMATVRAIEEAAAFGRFDALILLGDQVYPDGDPDRLDDTVFEPFEPLLDTGAVLLPILGNHDVMAGHGDENVARLGMPGRWYAHQLGDLLFVGLDSTDLTQEQLDWLDATLAAATARWRVVAVHHPPYSAGYQGSSLDVRANVVPILERHGVQLVLSGHEHDYQRNIPIRGVTYIVSGAAADTRRTGQDEFTAEAWSWHHFLDLAVYEDRMVVRAINQDVRVFDEVTIRSPAPGSG